MDCEEVFLCLAGRAVVVTSAAERPIEVGDCLVLPTGTDFSFRVIGDEPFQAVACIRGGGKRPWPPPATPSCHRGPRD